MVQFIVERYTSFATRCLRRHVILRKGKEPMAA